MFTQAIRLVAASFMLAALAVAPESAAQQRAGAIVIEDAWASASNPGTNIAAGYATFRNTGGQSDRLLSVSSARAGRSETHEMRMDGAIMRMRAVQGIEIPAGGAVTLAPGGLHIMFFNVDAPFVTDQIVPVTLRFERAGAVNVDFVVLPLNARRGHDHDHH